MSTMPLRRYLEGQGYDTRAWGLGRNLGPGRGTIEACFDMVRDLHRETGRKVSLVGWSLGGIYAREAAKVVPHAVRSVITFGTPFSGGPKSTNAWRVYEFASGESSEERAHQYDLAKAPPVPTTSIYSRTDGVVAWEASLQKPSGRKDTENIEVEASHIGLGVNPFALYAVADRLAQPEGQWQPFDRQGLLTSLFYGDPSRPGWWPKGWWV
jgi:pimeloyl-ACP methyl ester carboxylesterase